MDRVLFLVLFVFSISFGYINYSLEVEVDKDKLIGKAVIKTDEPLNVSTKGLNIRTFEKNKNLIKVEYEKNISYKDEIFLINFYPAINKLAIYNFKLKLPDKFIPVSEADNIEQKDGWYTFSFPYPLEQVNVVARKDYYIEVYKKNGLKIYGYFFKNGSKEILKDIYSYIKNYEEKFGKFPYKRFSVVETKYPYGFSFPTFTTINSYILNKPYIIKQSLAHEVLHQWFGCSVYVDFENGNWSEGLVTYYSNYNKQKNKRKYRKVAVEKYEAFWEKDIPLRNFIYKKDIKWEALGYGKGMFFFYMLSNYIGEKNLQNALKDFYFKNKFKKASWNDIEKSVKKYSDKKIDKFFNQWVYSDYVPYLSLEVLSLKYKLNHFELRIKIKQKKDFFLNLPVVVKTNFKNEKFVLNINKKEEEKTLKLKNKPLKVYLDPEFEIFRHTDETEYDPLIYNYISKRDLIINPSTIDSVENKNVVFTDLKNPLIRKLVSSFKQTDEPFIQTFINPLGSKKTITLINNFPQRLIIHFGNYSDVFLEKGKILKAQKISFYKNPVLVYSGNDFVSVNKGAFTFNRLISDFYDKRAVFIGENHPVFSNHISQLEIIKGIYQKNKNIVIGMEMFQKPFQRYIDDYINGKIDEITFLLKTQYYKRWGYDYRLYKPVLDFAKKHKIKVLALNAPSEIIEKVSKNGLKSLSENEKKSLPKIDFSSLEYKNYLKNIFKMHSRGKNFIYFYESQLIWDETMADTAYKNMEDKTLIVLAGNGHLRYRFGIPSRFERRAKIKPVVILNDDEIKLNIADFVINTEEIPYQKSPKLGVYLKETKKGLKVEKVVKGSLAEKIGIKKGDLIVGYNNYKINKVWQLKTFLTFAKSKDEILIIRKSKKFNLKLEL